MSFKDDAIRLLLADPSLNDAETFVSVLRNAGHAVRPNRVEDEDGLRDVLDQRAFDLFICTAELDELPISNAKRLIQQAGKDIPIIALLAEHDPQARLDAITAGAVDAVHRTDLRHLELVVVRELGNLQERRRLRRLEISLREVERRCHALLDNSRDAIAYVHEGMHIYANRAYLEKFGYASMDDLESWPLLNMAAPHEQARLKDFLRSHQDSPEREAELDIAMVTEQDEPLQVLMSFSPATVDGEACTQILIRDKAAAHDLAQQLDALSRQDLLTGLHNRQYFMEQLEQAVAQAVEGHGSGLLFIQLDNIETIQQTLGISAIDALIADIGVVIRQQVGEDGLAARFSDEAFAILLPRQSMHDAIALGEALLRDIEEHISSSGDKTITTTASIGISMVGENVVSAQAVVNDALAACEQAHLDGGNRVHLHTVQSDSEQTVGDDLQERLEAALTNNRFYIVYQPIVSLRGDQRERYQVRLRLLDDDDQTVMPADFIPQAEQLGLMPQIDRWVLQSAIQSLATNHAAAAHNTELFIKLAGPTLADPDFIGFIDEQLKTHGVDGQQLTFQLNEPIAVTQLNQARKLFRGLKELGSMLCLDHFGSGLNPFQLVKHLPADYLKLDHALTHDLASNNENQQRVKQIIENAHTLQRRVIVGHLEDASSLATLWQMQSDFVQGDFLATPQRLMNYNFSSMAM